VISVIVGVLIKAGCNQRFAGKDVAHAKSMLMDVTYLQPDNSDSNVFHLESGNADIPESFDSREQVFVKFR